MKDEIKTLLDYITNLQQENERLKKDYAKIVSDNCDYLKLEQENERLKGRNKEIYEGFKAAIEELGDTCTELKDYKSRCEKAKNKLSFIDEALENDILNVPLCITKINSALNILQGENNDN